MSGYDFSDGNRRTPAHLTFEQKVVDIPHLDVTLRPEIYASANSSSEGPYFSPRRDLSGSLTCDAEHVLWRRYERSFGHRLAVTGGAYWQEHFDTGVDRLGALRAGLSIQSVARAALRRAVEARGLRRRADAFHRGLRPPQSSLLMLRRALLFLLVVLALAPARAADRFAIVAFHDVVDFKGDLDDDAVTVDRLIGFFEWLRANRWTTISLDDVDAARRGKKTLPERSILITFDDGYRSLYTRVFPLVLAYRMPIVVALVGSWLDAPAGSKVSYGKGRCRGSTFSRGKRRARWRARAWSSLRRTATTCTTACSEIRRATRCRRRTRASTRRGAATKRRRSFAAASPTISRVRASCWRTGSGARRGRWCGLTDATTGRRSRRRARPGSSLRSRSIRSRRAFTSRWRSRGICRPMIRTSRSMVSNIQFEDPLPRARRLVAMNPAAFWTGDDAGMNERLGHAIERLRTLGATAVVLDAVVIGADGRIEATWFPNRQLPMRADILSRLSWQMPVARRSRSSTCGCRAARRSRRSAVPRKCARFSTISARTCPPADCSSMTRPGSRSFPADIPARRGKCARRAMPRGRENLPASAALALVGVQGRGVLPAGLAPRASSVPMRLRPARAVSPISRSSRSRRTRAPWIGSASASAASAGSRRIPRAAVGLWFVGAQPPRERDLISATRLFQRRGGTVIGWAMDDPVRDRPKAKAVEPTVSASTFPVKF